MASISDICCSELTFSEKIQVPMRTRNSVWVQLIITALTSCAHANAERLPESLESLRSLSTGASAQPLPAALESLRALSTGTSVASAASAAPSPAPASSVGISAGGAVGTPSIPPTPQHAGRNDAVERAIRMKAAEAEANKVVVPATCRAARAADVAVVTLISSNEGYPAGALALSAALEVLESELRRIVLVTPTVTHGIRELLRSAAWEVREVEDIQCNQVMGPRVTADKYELGESYTSKLIKWRSTCAKLHAWKLTFLRKVIFLDADTLVVKPIDSLVEHPSAFAAAPDTFPADQFNSGVMVLTPSARRFEELVRWNAANGTAEGGDQCLLNEFFGEWFYGAWDDEVSGRLPWIFNVGAAHFTSYRTLTRMQSRDEPAVVHFVGGESKPWSFMVLKFQGLAERIPGSVRRLLEVWDEMYWLAKTNRICVGDLSAQEREQGRLLLDQA